MNKDGELVSYDIYKILSDIFVGSHIYLFNNLLFVICLISLETSHSLNLKQIDGDLSMVYYN